MGFCRLKPTGNCPTCAMYSCSLWQGTRSKAPVPSEMAMGGRDTT
jgi:hypothetical protein